jgi:hypothetical protein
VSSETSLPFPVYNFTATLLDCIQQKVIQSVAKHTFASLINRSLYRNVTGIFFNLTQITIMMCSGET